MTAPPTPRMTEGPFYPQHVPAGHRRGPHACRRPRRRGAGHAAGSDGPRRRSQRHARAPARASRSGSATRRASTTTWASPKATRTSRASASRPPMPRGATRFRTIKPVPYPGPHAAHPLQRASRATGAASRRRCSSRASRATRATASTASSARTRSSSRMKLEQAGAGPRRRARRRRQLKEVSMKPFTMIAIDRLHAGRGAAAGARPRGMGCRDRRLPRAHVGEHRGRRLRRAAGRDGVARES